MIDLSPENIITIDFETYYDQDFTLSKLSMSEYIRDPRFHVHMVGIKEGDGETYYVTGKKIANVLKALPWKGKAMLAQNTQFDALILSHIYGIVPDFYLDTMSMARAAHGHHIGHSLKELSELHKLGVKDRTNLENTKGMMKIPKDLEDKLGEYCCMDVELTYKLFWKLYDFIPDDELRLIDLTMRMFADPVLRIDLERVESELAAEVGSKVAALFKSGATAEDLVSDNKFAALLGVAGVKYPPKKISPTTGQVVWAFAKTDEGMKDLLHHENEQVRDLANARLKLKSSIGETRARRFLEAGKDGMKLPVGLNYWGAHTGRWSGGNKMNLQNLKRGGELRKSILAPEGHVIVVADSAQIEARITAWLADQKDILEAFATKQDVYKLMASAIYMKPIEDITKDERFIGKTCVLGLGFGMGPTKLRDQLKAGMGGPPVDLPLDECKRIVNIYRTRNRSITRLWNTMQNALHRMILGSTGQYKCLEFGKNFIRLPNGLFLHYAGLHALDGDNPNTEIRYMTRRGLTKIYGGLLTENVVQALARVVIGECMIKLMDMGYRIVTMTHDEIVIVVPKEQADEALDNMIRIMSTPPEWAPDLPLSAEGGWDDCYSK